MSSDEIRKMLENEAIQAEERRDEAPGVMFRARTAAPRNVYTLRMPADRIAELQEVATEQHEQPSALVRRWVLERLASERAHQSEIAHVREMLTKALNELDRLDKAQQKPHLRREHAA
ncbi:MAG: hypothetical protein ACRD3Q_03265 [Terriglobales bacterium]